MLKYLKTRINLIFLVNPFYLYCIAFSSAIILYLVGWSKIYPNLSVELIGFLFATFFLFIIAGKLFERQREKIITTHKIIKSVYIDIFFSLVILLGTINIIYMGYLPVLDRSHDYREFGMPVIDVLFNTLSIFFSVLILNSFLHSRKKRFLYYFIIIIILQLLIFRRSTLTWIALASIFLLLLDRKKISLITILLFVVSIPFLSYIFGLYGTTRSNLTKSFVLNDLGASDVYKSSGLSPNHYLTYLYISSPLANLQETIDKSSEMGRRYDIRDFLFYCLIPESITMRLEGPMHLSPPECGLISPYLIVGSLYMVSFHTLGWVGMVVMFLYLSLFLLLCILIIKKYNTFSSETISLLCTTASLLIFSNFLNRLDVLLILFVYPVMFHFIFRNRLFS
jgi:hypothetical protein